MSAHSPSLHVYAREIRAEERTSLSVVAGWIPDGARVLDLGCGTGALGRWLLQKARQVTVDGVTLSEAEAEIASASYGRLVVGDLETLDLLQTFAGTRYDAIVCADVLEHLKQPEQVLQACRSLLQPTGQLLISVPNAGYCGLVAELLDGDFRYRDEGLLDRTHLRFFTRLSLTRFLREHGWALETLDCIQRELPESEFNAAFDRLSPSMARHLLATPDALTYQFVGVVKPRSISQDEDQPTQHAPVLHHPEPSARFSAQLYWSRGEQYDEAQKLVTPGTVGVLQQTLTFALAAQPSPLTKLRLDPADRPGFLHLYRLMLRSSAGDVLWHWTSRDGLAALLGTRPHQQMVWHLPPSAAGATMALLTGDEPWFELPLPAPALEAVAAVGGVLEVELGWPMSSDYLALSGAIAPLLEEQQFLRLQTEQIPAMRQEHEKLALEHAELHHLHAALHRQLDQEQRERQFLLAERQNALATVEDLQGQLRGMAAHVENLTRLRSVRYARALTRWLRPSQSQLQQALPAQAPAALSGSGVPAAQPHEATAPVPMPLSDVVDVIVPVYRGLADTQLCVESVLSAPVRQRYRLIVINDASPEPAVTQWLRNKAAQEPRITLLENEQNLGFVGTVNRGMRYATAHDVVLLNSDTEVANDWLDRLRKAAYRHARVGTVTPFSSNATICSYPVFCAANPLPPGQTTASLDALFAQANPDQAIDVPTGVGFCMYIRRDCLDAVGFFDEEHFGKGYGEENDFCQRAQTAGWRNLHALDTYVLHTGGVSFGESKSPREQAAMETLRRLHPGYEAQVMSFVAQDPALPARLAVEWLLATEQGRLPVVLAVNHDRGGGTQRHVLELAQTLADHVTFLSLKPAGSHHVVLQLVEPDRRSNSPAASLAALSDRWRAVFDLNTDQDRLVRLLQTLGVVHVHIHHLVGHHDFAWNLPQRLGVGYDFTAHDFYSFCTNITLTGAHNRYEVDVQGECCGGAHPPSLPAVVEKIEAWRIRNRVFLEGARYVLTPSLDTAQRMLQAFPTARVRCAPHTDLDAGACPAPRPSGRLPLRPLRVVVIGALSIIKGAEVLEATAAQAHRAGVPVEFHLIGFGYRHLQTRGSALTVHGEYDEADLPALLQRIAPDVAWFPALWPETYSYTLSAALQEGLPVVVPNLGAFVERVAGRPWSWVQAWDSTPAQWVELFAHIRQQMSEPLAQAPTAPALPKALQDLAQRMGPWSYVRDYATFAASPAHQDAADAARMAAGMVAEARATTPHEAPRGRLYRWALRLQRSALLGPLVRAVPHPVRHRIKGLLSR
ncbi:methyltransferase domain-containing protein [Acidovorax lacteus]|uniref:Glycosyltransferase 2-like domain-containing protein n=1 Tax=Acidovorax lacteus TaxID=1924988 RepID=A0ABP8KZY9_9BURK